MTDLLVLVIFLMFSFLGLRFPYISIMGYIWVDTIKPQTITHSFMNDKPLSFIMAIICIISFILHIKDSETHRSKEILTVLTIFLIWITITTIFSLYPELSWSKWDSSFKSILLSIFIPFFISNKSQLEAIIIAFIISLSIFTFAVGVKTILGGGGYGATLIPGNAQLSESSTLATYSAMIIPFYMFLSKYSIIFARIPYKPFIMLGISTLTILSIMGTAARTGFVGLFVLFVKLLHDSKRRILLLFVISFIGIIILGYLPDRWIERMQTMLDFGNESSALGRILVWKWTFDFVSDYPMGGGFTCYVANAGVLNYYSDNPDFSFNKAKAFHSIYFEVLGEHGYFGLFLYILLIYSALKQLGKIIKNSEDEWIREIARTLKVVFIIFLACGNFIGIAFQPVLYLMVAYTVSVYNLHFKDMENKSDNAI